MSWAGRRKGLYIGTASAIFILFVGSLGYIIFSKQPTCSDQIRNGEEVGVDCGGACSRMCTEDVSAPVVLWNRFFEVAPNIYTVAAYIQNNNNNAYVPSAPYIFKLFNSENVLIAERQGVASIGLGDKTIIVESNIATGNRVPARTFFEFTNKSLVWERGELPKIEVSTPTPDFANRRVSVVVRNNSTKEVRDLPVSIVLFDASETAIAASESLITRLVKGGSETVIFTWPMNFPVQPITADVRARITP